MKKHICFAFLSAILCIALSISCYAADHVEEGQMASMGDAAAYTDAAQINHWEAVATLTKLGVMPDKGDGAFHPADTLTRAEAAKLSAFIMWCGKDLVHYKDEPADPEENSNAAFSDIHGHWAEPYIAYCADLIIVSGRGDGRFDPDSPITGVELVKVALTTLGYSAYEYELLGDSWADQVDRLARWTVPSLYKGLDSVALTQAITRDDAAQIFYNALQAVPKRALGGHFSEDGRFVFHFVDAVKKDGSPATMLYCQFGLDEVTDLPAQPGNQ